MNDALLLAFCLLASGLYVYVAQREFFTDMFAEPE
jgi:hypothetical protein